MTEGRGNHQSAGSGGKPQVATVLGYVIGIVVLIGYFVWMCGEMASHASNGSAVPISIFGGALLGIIAGAAGLLSRKRGS